MIWIMYDLWIMYNQRMKTLQIPAELDLAAFISKEAHDLKSPFNRAQGFIKLVLKGMDGAIPDLAREDLATAYQNNLYAFVLVSGLVEAARLGRKERIINPVDCQLEGLIRQSVLIWKKQCPRIKPAEIIFSTSVPLVTVDEALFSQCLYYWIAYVVEFAPEACTIEILVASQPEGDLLFTIRSSGERQQPPPECDLTLYGFIARQILDLHKGKLTCAEEGDHGATIQFILPRM
jgi:signal transduction histidine kinase